MDRVETGKLLTIMSAAWPAFEVDKAKHAIWHEMLADVEFGVAQVALKKLILESPYTPSIADVRRQVVGIMTPPGNQMEPAEAWGAVLQAVHQWGYYREAEALGSLPDRVARVAKMVGWQDLCTSEEPDVVRAQFMRMYDQIRQRDNRVALLPQALKAEIKALSEGMGLRALPGGQAERSRTDPKTAG